jgi:NAD(P)-dependent dehydrogenase (short-subunit alcohol dehydrogenase family)
MPPLSSNKKLLLIGASRGLGFALAEEYLKRGWHVVATERVRTTSQLDNLLGADLNGAKIRMAWDVFLPWGESYRRIDVSTQLR